jgi:hypothetical protein
MDAKKDNPYPRRYPSLPLLFSRSAGAEPVLGDARATMTMAFPHPRSRTTGKTASCGLCKITIDDIV